MQRKEEEGRQNIYCGSLCKNKTGKKQKKYGGETDERKGNRCQKTMPIEKGY